MKKIYLLAGLVAMMVASCSTEEQTGGGYVASSTVTLNASLPNSGTRVKETADATAGLITGWSSDDQLDVLVNTNTVVSMTKGTGNTFTATPGGATVASGFNAGKTIYGVNNNSNDKITTALNGSQLKATLDLTGQDGTVDNLKKYDLMYGKGDPTGNITFNHKVCVLRLDINSSQLSTDGITSITGMTLAYVPTSGTQLFASQEVYNFGTTCDSTVTDAGSISLSNTTGISVASGVATVYIAVPNRQNLYGTLTVSITALDGTGATKNYVLTNAISLTNGRMLMSTVHPLAITGLSNVVPAVGDYLFSDGRWGTLANNTGKTPIAIIFSKTTSTADQAKGWTHGYAMALKTVNASAAYTWGVEYTNPTGKTYTTAAALIADKDGYTHTKYINSSTYPAGYAAATTYKSTVAAPASTSGWYLPSIGQWYDIFVNLGKMGSYTDGGNILYWNGQATTCVNNLNAYLTPLTSGTYNTFTTSDYYWSSSEYKNEDAYCTAFNSNSAVVLYSDNGGGGYKLNTYMIRGVLAF
jgi:hypothetical protein